ncbi:MAG: response regulator [Candidatus Hydrogenedentes bacterium]|nr:response regulator [Candidatus Hydrogenedentota bacterium]
METSETAQTGRILLVDDSPADLRLLQLIVSNHGHTPISFNSALTALEFAESASPDLILLDITMPEMSGFELYSRLKCIPALESIPTLFVSANTETFDKVHAFALGAVDYITKPYQKEEVLARINVHLSHHFLKMAQARTIEQLEAALAEVSELKGLLPICAVCKRVRDDTGYWNSIEHYISERSQAEFSHAICPACEALLYPDPRPRDPA